MLNVVQAAPVELQCFWPHVMFSSKENQQILILFAHLSQINNCNHPPLGRCGFFSINSSIYEGLGLVDEPNATMIILSKSHSLEWGPRVEKGKGSDKETKETEV